MSGKTKDEYAESNIPPHVKAIDARRAQEMDRVWDEKLEDPRRVAPNVKLAEWSERISYILHRLAVAGIERSITVDGARRDLEALQADIVKAMGE